MRARLAAVVLAVVVTGLGCGGGSEPAGERRDPFTAIEREFDEQRHQRGRAAPRWETLARLRGDATSTRTVQVSERAIQWRVRWTCESGDFRLSVSPAGRSQSAFEQSCPGRRTAGFIGSGKRRLSVDASGPWRLVVEQEVDTPLHEPPLRAMRSAKTAAARGRFYGVERTGRGTVRLHRLGGGRLALRLEGFETSANTDLFVWASRAERPRTTRQILARPHRTVAPLKATQGDQNYVVPRRIRRRDLGSVVIWCEPVRIVYAAAALRDAS